MHSPSTKSFLVCILILVTALKLDAQQLMNKEGIPILPEKHEIGISIDAAPFGTFFRSSGSSALSSSYLSGHPQTILAKYMKNDLVAYRLKARIGFGGTTTDNMVTDLAALSTNPSSTATVVDEVSTSTMNITLGFGIQKYRGKGRLRGFYGGEALISFGSGDSTFTYANALNSTNYPTGRTQITEVEDGSTFGLGLRGFLGAEYFFAAKMSLGFEYGWGLMVNSKGLGNTTTQVYDPSTGEKTIASSTGKSSNWSLDVDNGYGSLFVSLYF